GREKDLQLSLQIIGHCTERLIAGEALPSVMHDHHKAQVDLGVVPSIVQELIAEVEATGGAAKVIGAGGRNGGAGLVLAIGNRQSIEDLARKYSMTILPL